MNKKIYLITGCSKGFGRELAKYVSAQGDQVIATVRKQDQISEINALHEANIDTIIMDVSNIDQVNQGVNYILKEYGRVDVLINNAGYGEIGAIEDVSEERAQYQMDVNVHGPLRLMRAVLPAMRRQRSGYIVNITSIAGLRGSAGLGIYNASKFALEGIGEALAAEVAHLGIHVTNIEPGPFRTEWAGASATYTENIHPDYEASAGAFKTMLQERDGSQPGDPVKGAAAIYEVTKMNKPPVHLPLGNMAFLMALQKTQDLATEIKAFEHVGRQTDYS